MKKIYTLLVVAGMFILSLYFLVEVNYDATTQKLGENSSNTAYVDIPKINVKESINNESINYGVYHEPKSTIPDNGTVILFGHHTTHGSPFLNINQLAPGDTVNLQWPGVGDVKYTVNKTFIVPESYDMSVDQGQSLFLITCWPPGSTAERIIVQAQEVKMDPISTQGAGTPPRTLYAILLMGIFFVGGMSLSYFYPVKEDRMIIFIAAIALTLLLVVGFIFPLPTGWVDQLLITISSWFGG